jgi:hypothetical protein
VRRLRNYSILKYTWISIVCAPEGTPCPVGRRGTPIIRTGT